MSILFQFVPWPGDLHIFSRLSPCIVDYVAPLQRTGKVKRWDVFGREKPECFKSFVGSDVSGYITPPGLSCIVDKALDNDALTTGRKLEAEKAKIKTPLMYVVKESPQQTH